MLSIRIKTIFEKLFSLPFFSFYKKQKDDPEASWKVKIIISFW